MRRHGTIISPASHKRPGAISSHEIRRLLTRGRSGSLAYFAAMISETVLEKAFMPSPRSRSCSYFKRSAGAMAMFG